MSITSTITVNNTWQPIFSVPSTGYCYLQIIENFVGGRSGVCDFNTYTGTSSGLVTELVDCRGFVSFEPFLPASFSLDGIIQYTLRLNSNILEITVASGTYSLTFNSYSASQSLLSGPQGPQGDIGAQGFSGSQGPTGSPGLPRNTAFSILGTGVAVGTSNIYLLPAGSTPTISVASSFVNSGSVLSLSVLLGTAPGLGQSRTFQVRWGPTALASSALVTISDLNTTGQWVGSASIFTSIVVLATATASAASSTIVAAVHFTK